MPRPSASNGQSLRRNIAEALKQSMQRAGLASQPSKTLKRRDTTRALLSHYGVAFCRNSSKDHIHATNS
jgi:hypothetical protein